MAGDLLLISILTALWAWLGARDESARRADAPDAANAGAGRRAGERRATTDRPGDEDQSRPVV